MVPVKYHIPRKLATRILQNFRHCEVNFYSIPHSPPLTKQKKNHPQKGNVARSCLCHIRIDDQQAALLLRAKDVIFNHINTRTQNVECASPRLRVTAGAVLATPRQAPLLWRGCFTAAPKAQEILYIHIQNWQFYILSLDFALLP